MTPFHWECTLSILAGISGTHLVLFLWEWELPTLNHRILRVAVTVCLRFSELVLTACDVDKQPLYSVSSLRQLPCSLSTPAWCSEYDKEQGNTILAFRELSGFCSEELTKFHRDYLMELNWSWDWWKKS